MIANLEITIKFPEVYGFDQQLYKWIKCITCEFKAEQN